MHARMNIKSVGKAAAELQVMPNDITRSATKLGIKPHYINGVAHFDSADLERIATHTRGTTAVPGKGSLLGGVLGMSRVIRLATGSTGFVWGSFLHPGCDCWALCG